LHTDLCSPLATNPTWSGLSERQRDLLLAEGPKLWAMLVLALRPDVMLVSLGREWRKIVLEMFPRSKSFPDIFSNSPFKKVELYSTQIQGKCCYVAMGIGRKPFSNLTNQEKRKLSIQIGAVGY